MGIKNVIKKIGGKAGDKVAQLSYLSPAQVENVQALREKYLLDMPDPNDPTARKETERFMAANSIEIFNAYLSQIKELYIPIDNKAEYDNQEFEASHNIRYINITKWVMDKQENNLEKLVNVYSVLADEDCNIALVFDRKREMTNVYLAVVNNKNSQNNSDVNNYKEQIVNAIKGNFPGAEFNEDGLGVLPCFSENRNYSVSIASNIPTESSDKYISQTIEKLIDGIVPEKKEEEYTIVLLATPIHDIEDRKLKLGEFYSGLAPYASWSTNYTTVDNESVAAGATVGVNVGVSAGVQNTNTSGITDTDSNTINESQQQSIADSESNAHMEGDNSSHSEMEGSSDTVGVGVSASAGVNKGVNAEGSIGVASAGASMGTHTDVGINANYSHGWNRSVTDTVGKMASDTVTKGITKSVANTVGKAVTKAMATTASVAKGTSFGGNLGANFARSSTTTVMLGKNEGISQNYTNYNVQHALELLKEQMKRLEQSTALGMWDFAAYVVSEDSNMTNNVAHSYLALTLGEESYMSKSAINTWRGNVESEKGQAKEICNYIRNLRHPIFGLNPGVVGKVENGEVQVKIDTEDEDTFIIYPPIVTATTSLSGKELAYSLNFPQKSIAGLPVLECVEFGRNIVTFEDKDIRDDIRLGTIFHMHHQEKTKVHLSKQSLASHTFITGSTGSGKSNTIYYMLDEALKQGTKFLVVEPAKGEYKNVFGTRENVFVYGTNPLISPLLRIDPFSFPDGIHVLEHMDRLIEIFNVCWPMYAAMPAVLKSAVEKAYVDCGWDLVKSVNKYNEKLFPNFSDVARNVKTIINTSEYDEENKGAYKGSLLTRLHSLCNGINGMIFASDEITPEELFDENVIIDLSRVGSSETKSLIMGMMVLKLQEYRMASTNGMNMKLQHITVLEEAHNLLRRTSYEQFTEGSNLLSKSVEMLSNAIAEMRTYGEGFIIADQAPGLMDMSVIRNTNTKIILRLPDQADRELVGRAANLNENQITELAKLPCGVAAVYQNEWIQPVLCKVNHYKVSQEPYTFEVDDYVNNYDKGEVEESLLECIMERELLRKGNKIDLRALKSKVIKSKLETYVKKDLIEYLEDNGNNDLSTLCTLIYDFLSAENAIIEAKCCNEISDWVRTVVDKLEPSIKRYSNRQINLALALILYEQSTRTPEYDNVFCRFAELYQEKGGIIQ